MASDINNTTVASTTGSQQVGNVSVFTGGRVKTSTTHATELIPITGISDQYDDRFDDFEGLNSHSSLAGNNLVWNEVTKKIDFSGAEVVNSFYNIENYGAVQGEDITEILQTAVDFANQKTTVYIPGKHYLISDTIEFPYRFGGTVMGAGFGTAGNITNTSLNGSSARLIWTGATDRPMFKLIGSNLTFLGGLTLCGKPDASPDGDRAMIGILLTKPTELSGLGTGKTTFYNLTLKDFDIMFQCGDDNSTENCDNLTFNFFNTEGSCDTVYRLMTPNSMKHEFLFLHNRATCSRVFQVYAGGLIHVHAGLTFGSTLLEFPSDAYASGTGSNNGMFRFDNLKVDSLAGSDFKAVSCLKSLGTTRVIFNNLFPSNDSYFNNGDTMFDLLGGGLDLTLRDCTNIQMGTILATKAGGYGPNILIDRCRLGSPETMFSSGSGELVMNTGSDGYWLSLRDNLLTGLPPTPVNDIKIVV